MPRSAQLSLAAAKLHLWWTYLNLEASPSHPCYIQDEILQGKVTLYRSKSPLYSRQLAGWRLLSSADQLEKHGSFTRHHLGCLKNCRDRQRGFYSSLFVVCAGSPNIRLAQRSAKTCQNQLPLLSGTSDAMFEKKSRFLSTPNMLFAMLRPPTCCKVLFSFRSASLPTLDEQYPRYTKSRRLLSAIWHTIQGLERKPCWIRNDPRKHFKSERKCSQINVA